MVEVVAARVVQHGACGSSEAQLHTFRQLLAAVKREDELQVTNVFQHDLLVCKKLQRHRVAWNTNSFP